MLMIEVPEEILSCVIHRAHRCVYTDEARGKTFVAMLDFPVEKRVEMGRIKYYGAGLLL